MSDIDWSKAPSHATHWCPGNARIEAGWIYQAGGEFYSCYSDRGLEHIPDFPAWRKARLVPRPTAWTGDGLPPVGTVCEAEFHEDRSGRTVQIAAYFQSHVWFVDQEDGCQIVRPIDRMTFHCIRTPEQIAEEERNAAYKGMLHDLAAVLGISSIDERECDVLHALVEAGYRKAGDV